MNIAAEQAHVRKNLGEYARDAESDCARAMAEAERVLRELSLVAHITRQSNPGCSSTADETSMAPSLVSRQSAVPSLSPSIDRLPLDPGLDFVVHDDGMIELTEAGFRRMWQAHSAGLDTVIEVDRRELLRLPAPKLGNDPRAAGKRQADLIEAHDRSTQPIAELLKAEESSEAAMGMINDQ
jgi:hypothetical protein